MSAMKVLEIDLEVPERMFLKFVKDTMGPAVTVAFVAGIPRRVVHDGHGFVSLRRGDFDVEISEYARHSFGEWTVLMFEEISRELRPDNPQACARMLVVRFLQSMWPRPGRGRLPRGKGMLPAPPLPPAKEETLTLDIIFASDFPEAHAVTLIQQLGSVEGTTVLREGNVVHVSYRNRNWQRITKNLWRWKKVYGASLKTTRSRRVGE